MTVQGPADTPDPRDPQPVAEAAPPAMPPAAGRGAGAADAPGAGRPQDPGRPGPVLSLEERKAARARQQRAIAAALDLAAEPAPEAPTRPADRARGRPRPAPASPEAATAAVALPRPARPARARGRHWLLALSFVLLVLGPTLVTAWYLWERASPRYASQVGFSVRTEDMGSALDLLGGIASFAGSSSKDTDVLYRFIQSQEIVAAVDERLDLRAIWAKGDPERDPVFAYHPPGTIEDLHDHWQRMVSVYNDTGTGLLDIEVQAFAPEDSQAIAQAIYEESQELINRLSDIAQEDRTRHAREELDDAVERLKLAREAMTRFRNETQIVDPVTALQGQMGLLSSLEAQLAQTLIDLDLLRQTAGDSDPRVEQLLARVEVIEARMEEERAKLGIGRATSAAGGSGPEGGAFADLVGEFERIAVDQEFAQQAYVAAMAAYDSALAEGRQQSRYLAAHVTPTLAERADHPKRWTLTLLTMLFAFLAWMLLTLTAYALRDRR